MPGLSNSNKNTGRRCRGRKVRRRVRILGSLFTQDFNDGDVSDWTAATGANVSNGATNVPVCMSVSSINTEPA